MAGQNAMDFNDLITITSRSSIVCYVDVIIMRILVVALTIK